MPAQFGGAPGPGALTHQDALCHRRGLLRLRSIQPELGRRALHLLRRPAGSVERRPFEQAVHGLTHERLGRRLGCALMCYCFDSCWRLFHGHRGQNRQRECGRCKHLGYRRRRRLQRRAPRLQALPPARTMGLVRLHRGQHEPLLRARQRHIQGVEFLAGARLAFDGHGDLHAGRHRTLAGEEDEALRRLGLARPVQQHAHGLRLRRRRVGVEQQHELGLQPLGAMHGQQAHGVGIGQRGCRHTAGLERAHQRIRGGVACAIHLQGGSQQRLQVGQHGLALWGRGGGHEARQHVTVVEDGIERIVRRQGVEPALPADQNGRQTLQIGRQQLCFL